MNTRSYTMTARADAARETGERIIAAGRARFSASYFDDVTLDQLAKDAGVTVQTVIRRFGSKEGVVEAILRDLGSEVVAQRGEAPVGDVVGIVENLVAHYEAVGDLVLLLLRQEERVALYAQLTSAGKAWHAQWVGRVFEPWLGVRTPSDRRQLHAQLTAVCDLYTWYLLRRQQGLSRRRTEAALVGLLKGVLS